MTDLPGDLLYTKEHEWLRKEDDGSVTVGITDHAQAASDVYSPVAGVVVEVNEALADVPETINSDPYGDGWIVRLQPSGDAGDAELMTPDAYQQLLDELEV